LSDRSPVNSFFYKTASGIIDIRAWYQAATQRLRNTDLSYTSAPSQYPKKNHAENRKNCDVIFINLFEELENNANLSILIRSFTYAAVLYNNFSPLIH
jgi:hypothetical protein